MTDVVVNPGELRRLADRIDGVAGRAGGLAGRAVDGQAGATTADFPARPEGQRIAADWAKARTTFADGIALVRQSLDRFSAGVHASADAYEQTDRGGADDIARAGRSPRRAE